MLASLMYRPSQCIKSFSRLGQQVNGPLTAVISERVALLLNFDHGGAAASPARLGAAVTRGARRAGSEGEAACQGSAARYWLLVVQTDTFGNL